MSQPHQSRHHPHLLKPYLEPDLHSPALQLGPISASPEPLTTTITPSDRKYTMHVAIAPTQRHSP
jgi:hypothetical protein